MNNSSNQIRKNTEGMQVRSGDFQSPHAEGIDRLVENGTHHITSHPEGCGSINRNPSSDPHLRRGMDLLGNDVSTKRAIPSVWIDNPSGIYKDFMMNISHPFSNYTGRDTHENISQRSNTNEKNNYYDIMLADGRHVIRTSRNNGARLHPDRR